MNTAWSSLLEAVPGVTRFLGVAGVLCVWGCTGGGGSSSRQATAEEILTSLQVTEVANPPPATYPSTVDTEETVDPASWHPLQKPVTVFSPRAQILQIGANVGTSWNTLFQDALSVPPYAASVPIADDQAWEQGAAKTSVAADVDGDGLAEAVIVYVKSTDKATAYLRVLDAGAVTSEAAIPALVLSGHSFELWQPGGRLGIGTPWFPYLGSARGDVDGDGRDEVLLVDYDALHVLRVGADGAVSILESKKFTGPSGARLVSSVAAGDLDGDRKDELAVGFLGTAGAGGAQWALYDSSLETPITNPEIGTLDGNGSLVELAFGDFKGNNLKQLAACTFLAAGPNAGRAQVTMFDFSNPPESALSVANTIVIADYELGAQNNEVPDYFRLLPRAVRLSGLRGQELHVLGHVYTHPMTGSARVSTWGVFHDWDFIRTVTDVQVGDLDNDAKEDLIILSSGFGQKPVIEVIGESSAGAIVRKQLLWPDPGDNAGSGINLTAAMAVGNFADNAARVRYAGHKLTFTDPIVIAVLAAPPYWSTVTDVAYRDAYPAWLTTFGTTKTTGQENSHTVGFSVGASLEYDHDLKAPVFGFTIANFKASVEFKNTNTWQWDSSREVSKSIEYGCSGAQDQVIFTAVPMDEYRYEIVASNDPANEVGKYLYINIPRPYTTYKVSRDFFNANTGNVIAPIGHAVLGHRVGDPASYPDASRKDQLLGTYFGGDATAIADHQIGPSPVAQGADGMSDPGSTNLTITFAEGYTRTVSHEFSLDTSIGAGVGDWTVSVTAGFNAGYSASSTASSETTFGGTVGYLPTSYYGNPNYFYSAGLFVYPYQGTNGKSFWVVDYWVE